MEEEVDSSPTRKVELPSEYNWILSFWKKSILSYTFYWIGVMSPEYIQMIQMGQEADTW